MSEETFTLGQIRDAIQCFLQFGDSSLGCCQKGYFSGGGWAARALRYHLSTLQDDKYLFAIERHDGQFYTGSFWSHNINDALFFRSYQDAVNKVDSMPHYVMSTKAISFDKTKRRWHCIIVILDKKQIKNIDIDI